MVAIDAGHGGIDPGAVGKKAKEKDINLAVALLTGKYIEETHPDVKVIYTRSKDVFVGLKERANFANKHKANLFISIHTNASKKGTPQGAEVFVFGISKNKANLEVVKRENEVILLEKNYEEKYEGFNPNSDESYIMFEFIQNKYLEQSIDFAAKIQDELVKNCKRVDRGVKQAGYLVLHSTSMPSVLIELDFISHSEAEKYMISSKGQKAMAQSICNGFSQYKKEYDRKSAKELKASKKKKEKNTPNISTSKTYKVQILTSGKQLANNSSLLKGYKADYYVENNMYKYTYGESSSWEEINKIKKSIVKDFKDAFIITFENGVKVNSK